MNSQTAKDKYFKYKTKYMQLKKQLGGLCATCRYLKVDISL